MDKRQNYFYPFSKEMLMDLILNSTLHNIHIRQSTVRPKGTFAAKIDFNSKN